MVIERGELNKKIPNIFLKEGEILSIMGESGTGKSSLILTLFKVIEKKVEKFYGMIQKYLKLILIIFIKIFLFVVQIHF